MPRVRSCPRYNSGTLVLFLLSCFLPRSWPLPPLPFFVMPRLVSLHEEHLHPIFPFLLATHAVVSARFPFSFPEVFLFPSSPRTFYRRSFASQLWLMQFRNSAVLLDHSPLRLDRPLSGLIPLRGVFFLLLTTFFKDL